jgi:DNA mismatch repair protein MutL
VISNEGGIGSSDSCERADVETIPADALDKKYKIIGEAFLCYVMVEKGNELIIIDKHAAHERLLFEQLKRQIEKNGAVNSQSLIIPINIASDDFSCALMREFMDDFVFAGFDIVIRRTSVDIFAIPDGVSASDAEELFGEISRAIIAGSGNPARTFASRREKSLYQIACKAAIKAGRNYDEAHIEWLVEKVMSMPDITVCPHGRPIAMTLTKNELDRRFNRLK